MIRILDLHLDTKCQLGTQSIAWEQGEGSSYAVCIHVFIHCFIPGITQGSLIMTKDQASQESQKSEKEPKKIREKKQSKQVFVIISADIQGMGEYMKYYWFLIVYDRVMDFLEAEESYVSSPHESEHLKIQKKIFE